MESRIEMIGPEEAKVYLETANGENPRPLRANHVKWFADLMIKGDFRLTHQGLAFDVNGKMKDGQHRLHAIIAAGVTVPMLVSYKVPEASFEVVDSGMTRSIYDRFNTTADIAAIINVHHFFMGGRGKTLPSYFAKTLEWVGPLYTRLINETTKTKRNKVTVAATRYGALLNMLVSETRAQYAIEQYKALASGDQSMAPVVYAFRAYAESKKSEWNTTRNIEDQGQLRSPIAYHAFQISNSHHTRIMMKQVKEAVSAEMKSILRANGIT